MMGVMILVAGEALVDLVIEVDGRVTAAIGGAPYNTARACGRLGADVAFLGAISVDRFGTMMATQLADDGVSTDLVARIEQPTTLAAAELDDGGAASYRFYIEGTSAPALASVDATLPRPPPTWCSPAVSDWCSSRWPPPSRRWWPIVRRTRS